MTPRQPGLIFALALNSIAVASFWHAASAQAWVGPKGSLTAGLDYNLSISNKVVDDDGAVLPNAGSTVDQFTLGAEYVPIRHLAVDVSLPMQILEYTGDRVDPGYVHAGGGRYDDGNYHETLTDLRAGVHYQLLEDPIALSPIVAVSIPVQNYETVGNTVAGRHLKALHLGLALGRELTENLYAHVVYEFAIVSKYDHSTDTDTPCPDCAKYGQDTSDATVTLGYKLLDGKLDVNVDGNLHITHDGIDFSKYSTYPMDVQLYHDAVLREDMLLVGGGVGYQISNSVNIAAAVRVFTWGVNTINASVFGLALTWTPL